MNPKGGEVLVADVSRDKSETPAVEPSEDPTSADAGGDALANNALANNASAEDALAEDAASNDSAEPHDAASPQAASRQADSPDDASNESTEPAVDLEKADEVDADEADAAEVDAAKENMDWYILKVQSNREDSIRDGLMRRVRIAGLDEHFDEVLVPTETVTEYKDGKRKQRKQKLWPGYIIVHMEITDDTWFLVRETPGIGDFTGAGGKPTPMLPEEVEKILKLVYPERHAPKEKAPVKIAFNIGDRVKIKEGTFLNFDGEVDAIDHTNGRVTVMTEIFNRKTPVEVDYWQIERV